MSFYSVLEKMCQEKPEHILFSFWQDKMRRNVSVEQWVTEVFNFAAWMEKRKIKNMHIEVVCSYSYEWYVIVFGLIISGNVAVSINPDLSEEELLFQIKNADIQELYYDSRTDLGEVLSSLPQTMLKKTLKEVVHEAEKEAMGKSVRDEGSDEEQCSFILFSSGTSGMPKGVMLSQKNLLNIRVRMSENLDGTAGMIWMPVYHIGGITFTLDLMCHPITICIGENYRSMIRDIKRFEPAVLILVPSQLEFLLKKCKKDEELRQMVFKKLKYIYTAGAALDVFSIDRLEELQVECINVYGLTEVAGPLVEGSSKKNGSVGKFRAENEMKLDNGELTVKGPSVMKGYYNCPEETANALRDGWFYTGDLVSVDSEGELHITGRSKNIIILSNGENISPENLERKIKDLNGVEEVIVTGRNNVLEAVIYCGEKDSKECRMYLKEQIRKMNKKLPRFQQIQKITFGNQPFEKTGSGKIKRF